MSLSTPLHLQQAGVETVPIDRSVPGCETSLWSAGILATSSLQSIASPSIYRRLPAIFAHRAPGARIHLRAICDVLPWGLRLLLASQCDLMLRTTRALHTLISRFRTRYQELLALAGASDLLRREGWPFLHRSPRSSPPRAGPSLSTIVRGPSRDRRRTLPPQDGARVPTPLRRRDPVFPTVLP